MAIFDYSWVLQTQRTVYIICVQQLKHSFEFLDKMCDFYKKCIMCDIGWVWECIVLSMEKDSSIHRSPNNAWSPDQRQFPLTHNLIQFVLYFCFIWTRYCQPAVTISCQDHCLSATFWRIFLQTVNILINHLGCGLHLSALYDFTLAVQIHFIFVSAIWTSIQHNL